MVYRKNQRAFTIVELLVVIVVIGILAAITIVSYTGISQKATASSLQSDLSNGAKKLKMYYVEYGKYPQFMTSTDSNVTYCPSGGTTTEDTKYCIKPTPGSTFIYDSPDPYSTFTLTATHTASTTAYNITNDTAPLYGVPIPTVSIGTQTWMKYNLDVGIRIDGATAQTNDGIVQKWCYNNDPANCAIYGGLYQWGETVQYKNGASNTTSPNPVFSGNIQGIAPAGFHIPNDSEYTTLTTYLGGESDKMKSVGFCQGRTPCGTSGFDAKLAGSYTDGSWMLLNQYDYLWSSSQYDASTAWSDVLLLEDSGVRHSNNFKRLGFSVRAIKD